MDFKSTLEMLSQSISDEKYYQQVKLILLDDFPIPFSAEGRTNCYIGKTNNFKNIFEFWLACIIRFIDGDLSYDLPSIIRNGNCEEISYKKLSFFVEEFIIKNNHSIYLNKKKFKIAIRMKNEWNDVVIVWHNNNIYGAYFWVTGA